MKYTLWILIFFCLSMTVVYAQAKKPKKYTSYKGLVMAGYQGWFNAPSDGANRKWHHYSGPNGFRPGSCTIDFWPEVSEYERTYETEFCMADGTPAVLFLPTMNLLWIRIFAG